MIDFIAFNAVFNKIPVYRGGQSTYPFFPNFFFQPLELRIIVFRNNWLLDHINIVKTIVSSEGENFCRNDYHQSSEKKGLAGIEPATPPPPLVLKPERFRSVGMVVELRTQGCWLESPARPIFFFMIDDIQCDRMNFSQDGCPLFRRWLCGKAASGLERISCGIQVNPFPNKPWFLRVCHTYLSETLLEKEKLLETSNFSFYPQCFLPFLRTFRHLHQD